MARSLRAGDARPARARCHARNVLALGALERHGSRAIGFNGLSEEWATAGKAVKSKKAAPSRRAKGPRKGSAKGPRKGKKTARKAKVQKKKAPARKASKAKAPKRKRARK